MSLRLLDGDGSVFGTGQGCWGNCRQLSSLKEVSSSLLWLLMQNISENTWQDSQHRSMVKKQHHFCSAFWMSSMTLISLPVTGTFQNTIIPKFLCQSSTHTHTPVKGRTWLKPITRTDKLCQLKSLSEPCHGHLVPEGERFLPWACLLLSQAEYHTHSQKEAHYNSTHRQNDSIKYGPIHSQGTDTDKHLYLHAYVWHLVRKWTRLIQPEA